MTPLQIAIIAAARECIETPFRHQGRIIGRALDCVGVACHVMARLQLPYIDQSGYPRLPYKGLLTSALNEQPHLCEVEGEMRAGDLLLMRFMREPQHVAILTDTGTIIHAWYDAGKCCEHDLTPEWRQRIVKVYRIVEVTE